MISDSESHVARTDRNAAISFAAGMLAVLALCVAVIPVPFTGYVCFPAAGLLAVLALVHGVRALGRFRTLQSADKSMAVAGLAASVLTVLTTACSGAVAVMLGVRLVEALGRLIP